MTKFYAMWRPAIVRALEAERVATYQQLAALSPAILLGYKGLGLDALRDIEAALEREGLALEGTTPFHLPAPTSASSLPTGHCVYFVRAGDLVKIGLTRNIRRRLKTAQTFAPLQLALLHAIPCQSFTEAKRLEHDFHVRFRAQRTQGEWFRLEGALNGYVLNQESAP